MEHERAWDQADELRAQLEKVRLTLVQTAEALGAVAGAADLVHHTSTDHRA
ncbi:hypothetical protein [Streptomyces collinus]|uniref:hypothetical protein n=1 Tax=Streptomyces collinus TaxID=42684 RepID=UPI00368A4D72